MLALALIKWEDTQHECGQPMADAFNPDNEDEYTAVGFRCWACAAAAKLARSFEGDTDGLSISVRRTEPDDRPG